ncbi:MAG TPA: PASTA domain-containing protein [Kofleriaceae bacterium]|nr:PASTA domain-containing protein [Kofleriaceae bacterium]
MWKSFAATALCALSACQFSTSMGGGPHGPSTSTTPAPTSGPGRSVTMPNLFGMTRAEAEATLARLGFQKPLSIDDHSLCGSVVDGKIVELGRVCYQSPAPGQSTSTTLTSSVRIQTENPYGGTLPGGRTWFLMPNLVGQPVDAARAKLRELGYVTKDVKIAYVDDCGPNLVCRTGPEPLTRTDTTSDKVFWVGRPDSTRDAEEGAR